MEANRKIRVKNSQVLADQSENTETASYQGNYYFKNGKHYLLYRDAFGKSMIVMEEAYAKVVRGGESKNSLEFTLGERVKMPYQTPYGTFEMETYTRSLEAKDGRFFIEYELFLDGISHANCRIEIIF